MIFLLVARVIASPMNVTRSTGALRSARAEGEAMLRTKTALVTGASRGIGKAIAIELARSDRKSVV